MKNSGKEKVIENEENINRKRRGDLSVKGSKDYDDLFKKPVFPKKEMLQSDHPHQEEIAE